jgi:hypothetical protein
MSATRWNMQDSFSLLPKIKELVVAEAGSFERGEGMIIAIQNDCLTVRARTEGGECEARCALDDLLESICTYTRERGN